MQGRTGWNLAALIGFILFCAYTLLVIYQQRVHLDTSGFSTAFSPSSSFSIFDDLTSPNLRPSDTNLEDDHSSSSDSSSDHLQVDLVVASLTTSNTSWIAERLHGWRAMIYHVDDRSAPLTVPVNKGKEAMVYLTYIIDHYAQLPDVVIFRHSDRFQWHTDDPDYDGVAVLRNLQLPYIRSEGYVNLRCVWVLGCPAEIRPFQDEGSEDPYRKTASVYKRSFEELMPGREVPTIIAQSCCAQFAASRETIVARGRDDYIRMREWLINTSLDDATSGRVFEYLWHVIFGKEPVYCPDANGCYCKLFGLCDLQCEQGQCENRYTLPPSVVLPDGWPFIDWDGSPRRFLGIAP